MGFKDTIDRDLKAALLGGDKEKASVLRGIKSAVLYAEVAKGVRDSGLAEEEILSIVSKEAKKRQESADLYVKGGNQEKADAELREKKIIEAYLPAQLNADDINTLIDEVVAANGPVAKETMGATIAAVKEKSAGAAEGALIAKLVRERIAQ